MIREKTFLSAAVCLMTLPASILLEAADFHVTPNGSPKGDGSPANPWDLQTALAHPAAVKPGDTIWLHEGTYKGDFTSSLAGAPEAPITVKPRPGQWARIEGIGTERGTSSLTVKGSWTHYVGFEVLSPNHAVEGGGLWLLGPSNKLINLVVHDVGNNGFWEPAFDTEIYGCLFYVVGGDPQNQSGYPVYMNNKTGTKRLVDNIFCNNFYYGIHAYTRNGSLNGLELIGNIWFNSSAASAGDSMVFPDCLIGGSKPAERIVVRDNCGYSRGGQGMSLQLGYKADNVDATVTGNYFYGHVKFATPWRSITMTGNSFSSLMGRVDLSQYPGNTALTSRPTANKVFIRPNQYMKGRAHVAVYNWEGKNSVAVDLGKVLTAGMAYEVRNAQNYFAPPVASGVYSGAAVKLPMTGLAPAQPLGKPQNILPSEQTGKEFNVFVVVPKP